MGKKRPTSEKGIVFWARAARLQALAECRLAIAEYHAKKADTAVDDVELVRS